MNDERLIELGLWSLRGVGPKSIAALRQRFGALQSLADRPPPRWLPLAVELPVSAQQAIAKVPSLRAAAERVLEGLAARGHRAVFLGEPGYPQRLAEVETAPPVLFMVGPGADAPPRRRVAMVGTRNIDPDFLGCSMKLAAEVAAAGVGIVSGAALGVDTECHRGALSVRAETWAFVGSALDELDPHQVEVGAEIVRGGGTVFSEFPPGTRAERSTFPRRNRLISGASDAVVLLRGGRTSGALHTVRYAKAQGRVVLAMPGEANRESAAAANGLLRAREALVCLGAGDVLDAVGVTESISGAPVVTTGTAELSDDARRTLETLGPQVLEFDELARQVRDLRASAVLAALLELELAGLVLQKPGRRFERT